MQSVSPTSQMFQADQQTNFAVEYWDTPFTPVVNDIASGGIPIAIREPYSDGTFTLVTALTAASAAATEGVFNNAANSKLITENGRIANIINYWSGGAPGVHGASVAGRVAYHFKCTLRSATARSWFSGTTTISALWLALGGQGYFKVVKNATTVLFNRHISERDYLSYGLLTTATFSATTNDVLDIYYVQDGDIWGGYVVKAVAGTLPTVVADQITNARYAPVIGCGLFDDGTPPTKVTLDLITDLTVQNLRGQTRQSSFTAKLINPTVQDGVGWEWVRNTGDTTGFLRLHTLVGSPIDVRRQRLVRVKMGFKQYSGTAELYNQFTGWVDDFDSASSGSVTVKCLGTEQRLTDQSVKNYPDRMSYIANNYFKLNGTSEPVYNIPAYDNWYMELALRDLLLRAGVDESRTRAPLTVPAANGTSTPVIM